MNVYRKCPVYQKDGYMLRLVSREDAPGLIKVYSDPMARPFFNSDNCSGGFRFDTLEEMQEVIDAWRAAYDQQGFVRWSVIECKAWEAVGTIELFHRDAEDAFTNTGLLRLDLRSDYEQEDTICLILSLIVKPAYELFDCVSIATKAIPRATERRAALKRMGFKPSSDVLVGHDGTEYSGYFVCARDV